MQKAEQHPLVVLTCGGFDPLHIGHVRLIKHAKELAGPNGKLVVVVNGDGWLVRKKGYAFMPADQRMEIVRSLKYVDEVIEWDDGGPSVAGAILKVRPDIFAKGGDRVDPSKLPPDEVAACEAVGCKMVFNVGQDGKSESSSWLLSRFFENAKALKETGNKK